MHAQVAETGRNVCLGATLKGRYKGGGGTGAPSENMCREAGHCSVSVSVLTHSRAMRCSGRGHVRGGEAWQCKCALLASGPFCCHRP